MNLEERKNSKPSIKNRSKSILIQNEHIHNQFIDDDCNFDVKTSNIMGRYMVARKELKPGEIVLSEEPLVVGPCTGCKVLCLGCYINLEETNTFVACPKCGWPLCSLKCNGLNQKYGHTQIECTILKECKSSNLFNLNDFNTIRIHLNCIVPLRCLLLKTIDPTAYDILMNMEHHNGIRRNLPDLWNNNQINIVDRILNDWHLTEFTHQEIHTICGILEVNAFEIGQQGINIRGIYPTAYLMSHDCIPNTNHTDEVENYRLIVRASIKININEPITISYAYTLQSTLKRRQHLLENKFFECFCKRCSDPSELGTYTGALLCPKCSNGLVLPDKPLDMESTWSCTNFSKKKCIGYTITAKSIKLLLERISQEIEQIDLNDINGFESILQKYRNVLHPTHYLCLGIKVSLSQLYGKINGYLIQELDERMIIRKRDICKEILNIFNVIEPGYTRIRGVTLYELHAPLMLLLTRSFEDDDIPKDELKNNLKEIVKCLWEANVILSNEPSTSPEGVMGEAAKIALTQIKDWEKILGKI